MEEILTLANKLGGLSFATLLVIILAGSYFRVWRWGRDYDELSHERDWWRSVALRATGIAETQGHLLRVKEEKSMEELNKRFAGDG